MEKTQYQVIIGGLLHDIGKVVYPTGDGDSHPKSGQDFLKEIGIADQQILDQVRYHHADTIKNAQLQQDSLAYITYLADTIASAMDRRDASAAEQPEAPFSRDLPLSSIFNLLNVGEEQVKKFYASEILSEKMNLPKALKEVQNGYDPSFYRELCERIRGNLRAIQYQESYVNSLLEVLEANLTYVPSSTNRKEESDISLFDHCKLTAALGSAILAYLEEQKMQEYRGALYRETEQFYEKKAFLLYSMDLSGIQDFIYTITSDGALKALRARSFYLELLMEHLIDTLLQKVGLSRASCIYVGGGHSYLLLANTDSMRRQIQQFERETNEWLLKTFGTGLYLAGGFAPCSANDLKNKPEGSYREIFREISTRISGHKLHRYSAEQLIQLNQAAGQDGMRECSVCHRTDRLTEGDKCQICAGLEAFSRKIQDEKCGFFAVSAVQTEVDCLPLPAGAYLFAETEEGLRNRIQKDAGYLRCYSKNGFYTGQRLATKLWVADYKNGEDFHTLAQNAQGAQRLAVFRADVDNLGQAFVSGFEHPSHGRRYVTLSRTATFSRKLSLFFKLHLNGILEQGKYFLADKKEPKRSATVVYAGGDDVFVIGAWDTIIGFAVDLHQSFSAFAQGRLTLSAGISLYPEKYPVSAMARETGELEEFSKAYPGKNAVTLFDETNTYCWDAFINGVLKEKYRLIREFFSSMEDYGKSFLYKLLELMRSSEEKINLARYAYLLARMEPDREASPEQQASYQQFSRKMYSWMQDDEQRKQAITAITLYIYTIRESDEKGAENHGAETDDN